MVSCRGNEGARTGGEERKIVSASMMATALECGLQARKFKVQTEAIQAAGRAIAEFVDRLENRRRATVPEFESLRFRHLTPLEAAPVAAFAFLASADWDACAGIVSASFCIVSACHAQRVGSTTSPTRRYTVSVMRLSVCPSRRDALPRSPISEAALGRMSLNWKARTSAARVAS